MEHVKFKGIDRFNRPVFKSMDRPRHFYGCVDKLFSYDATQEDVLKTVTEEDLVFFGSRFDCEPYGTVATNLVIVKRNTL